jgi:hypothetical protein
MRIVSLFVVLALLSAPAEAYRRPKNPRKNKKAAAVAAASAKKPEEGLPPGRWVPEVRAALMKFVLEKGAGSPGYDAAKPPVAVLAFENASVEGDPAELVFQRLVRTADFKTSEDFWKQIPIAYGRQKLRAAYEQFSALPPAVWAKQPAYHQFRKAFTRSYQSMCERVEYKECRGYLARLMIGFGADEAFDYAKGAMDEERQREPGVELVGDSLEDDRGVPVGRGLRDVPEMRALAAFLEKNGVQVWLIGLASYQVLAAAAEGWEIPKERILGIKQGRFRERFDGKPEEPIPIRGGAVEAVARAVGRPPDLVVGAIAGHEQLMGYGEGLRIALDRDPALADVAKKRGWLIQRSFF